MRRAEHRTASSGGAPSAAGGWRSGCACWHLRLRGWRIVARGWRCPAGEIDIIARRGRVLAIIEVKSRGEIDVAATALAPRQRRRIARAAEAFLAARPDLARARPPIRCDAGRAASPAAPLARRLARRRIAAQRRDRCRCLAGNSLPEHQIRSGPRAPASPINRAASASRNGHGFAIGNGCGLSENPAGHIGAGGERCRISALSCGLR